MRNFQLDIKEYVTWENSIALLLGGILIILSTVNLGIGWGKILNQLTVKKVPQKEISNIYIKSNLSKYIPGNVMQFVGRNILAKEYDISQQVITLSTIYELGILALIGSSIIILSGQLKVILNLFSLNLLIIIMIVVVVILGILVVFKITSRLQVHLRSIDYKVILKCIKCSLAFYVMGLLLMGISFVIVLYTFNSLEVTMNNVFLYIGVFILAWFVGFITPGAPGGIGIRETVLMVYMGNLFSGIHIIELVAIHRIINVISDISIYLINILLSKGRKKYE